MRKVRPCAGKRVSRGHMPSYWPNCVYNPGFLISCSILRPRLDPHRLLFFTCLETYILFLTSVNSPTFISFCFYERHLRIAEISKGYYIHLQKRESNYSPNILFFHTQNSAWKSSGKCSHALVINNRNYELALEKS